jgi:protein-S-isoprenylcysteine O-methyltransferase Ste14
LVLGRISHELVAWQEGAYKVVPIKAIIFIIAIIIVAYFSRASLRNPKSHGFYRLFAWISIVALILLNIDWWFDNPFSIYQIISWVLLIISAFLITRGVILLQRIGKPDNKRNDASLLGMEKTTKLVVEGAYRYIRHPMYSSLLFLGWGAFFKSISILGMVLVVLATIFLILTGKMEEKENIRYFGREYEGYIKKTKMFIPFVL